MALTSTIDNEPSSNGLRAPSPSAPKTRRGRLMLMLAEGESYSRIEATVSSYRDHINRCRRRVQADRLDRRPEDTAAYCLQEPR
jgi:hypothetical protein